MLGSIGCSWFSADVSICEWLLYVVPEERKSTAAYKIIKRWEKLGASKGAVLATVGSSLGYRTEAVVKMYEIMGYNKNDAGILQKELKHVS